LTLVAAGAAAALALLPAGSEAATGAAGAGKTGAKVSIELKGAAGGAAGAGMVAGELVAVRKDALVIAFEDGDSRAVAIEKIARIEVRRRTKARTGGIVGAATGAAAGIAMSVGKSEEGVTFLDELSSHLIVGAVGMLLGGAMGVIVGGQFGGDKAYDLTAMSAAEMDKMMAALRKRARVKELQ
jgi:hypothetical protein